MNRTVRIATRQSPLAIWQAEHVAERLQIAHPGLSVQLVGMSTRGDRWLHTSLAKIGGKNLFVKELEHALQTDAADLAVHSMKDVGATLPPGLGISTVLTREDPSDALVSLEYDSLDHLPDSAVIGTCSVRRRSQLLALNPRWTIRDLRGNVGTRLSKLDAAEFDAILLASAGLLRLELEERIRQRLPFTQCLPAIGQGIIGIETRNDDQEIQEWLAPLHDADTAARLDAERTVSAVLAGGCSAPIAGHATLEGNTLKMTARVLAHDGGTCLESCGSAPREDAVKLGEQLSHELIRQGARSLLDEAEAVLQSNS